MKRRVINLDDRLKNGKELNIKINTSFLEVEAFVNTLKRESSKKTADYLILKKIWFELISRLPFPIQYSKGSFILRSRPNFDGEVFSSESQLSYNPNIKKVKLGRFNLDREPVFYGALPVSTNNANGTSTAIFESCKELFDSIGNISYQYFTIGRFKVVKPIPVVLLTFYDVAWRQNNHIQNVNPLFTDFLGLTCDEEDNRKCQLVYSYISEFAGRRIDTPNNYFLTTSFFNAMKEYHGNEIGMLYSSSMTENYGLNLVLSKEVIDARYVCLDHVVMYKGERNPSINKQFSFYPCSNGSDVTDKGTFALLGIR